ncbi:hypothetical protein KKI24_25825 [bacterium]|nr:hypothetical protein [bacterium]
MKLKPENLTALIDNREQTPFDLKPMMTERATTAKADYSVKGFEDLIAVERKEFIDLVGYTTTGRCRFEREQLRMKAYPSKCVVIKGGWSQLATGSYRSQVNPLSVTHTIAIWISRYGAPFQFCGRWEFAQDLTQYFLFSSAKRIHGYLENSFTDILRQAS